MDGLPTKGTTLKVVIRSILLSVTLDLIGMNNTPVDIDGGDAEEELYHQR